MKLKLYEVIEFCSCVIGFAGMAGAIECGTGLVQSTILLLAGAVMVYYDLKKGER
ncbi:MAG: hypothetical protein MR992_00370 [Lachnospiraceae bacterium]|nr:hypothetical protein [Lachnospiraceae bacterium]MDD7627838.1 hypothetical protein [Lachnospiraceae bacterium]MDY4118796.1 hypothetical protein [Lachnospiraceae bacterium]